MTKIKICGIKSEDAVEVLNRTLPEYTGFMFYDKSKRYISVERASTLRDKLDKRVKTVGVFVDEDPEKILDIARKGIIDIIQLHGSENDGYINAVKSGTGLPVIKAFRIDSAEDITRAQKSAADMVLLDSGSGGTGTSFDWRLIRDIGRDYFLAGGLSPENVEEAVRSFSPFALDVSSGVETDGSKDGNKIEEFIRRARSCPN